MAAVDSDADDKEAILRAMRMHTRLHCHMTWKKWGSHEIKAALGTDQMATIPFISPLDSPEMTRMRLKHFVMDLTNAWNDSGKEEKLSLTELVEKCEQLVEIIYDDEEAERRIAADPNVRFVREVRAFALEHSIVAAPTFSCGVGGVRGRAISCRTRAACDLLQARFPDEEVWMVEPL